MKRFHISVEVAPIDPGVVERLKAAGFAVFRGRRSWRVESTQPVLGRESVRSQAHVFVRQAIEEFGLVPLADPPAFTLRDPDGGMDDRPDLVLGDARRADDPQPMKPPKHRWYQHDLDLDLRERNR